MLDEALADEDLRTVQPAKSPLQVLAAGFLFSRRFSGAS